MDSKIGKEATASSLLQFSNVQPDNKLSDCLEQQLSRLVDVNNGGNWAQNSTAAKRAVVRELLEQGSDLDLEVKAAALAVAEQESGFNPDAQSPSTTANGVFQIIDRTWAGLGYAKSARSELSSQIQAGLALMKENLARVLNLIKSKPSPRELLVDLYTLHHDGPKADYGGRAIAENEVLPRFERYYKCLLSDS